VDNKLLIFRYCALVLGFVPQRQPTLSLLGGKLFSMRSACLKFYFCSSLFVLFVSFVDNKLLIF